MNKILRTVKKIPHSYLIFALVISVGVNIYMFLRPPIAEIEPYTFLFGRADELNPENLIINFVPLRKAIQSYVSENNGTIGVYFEYLPTGVSIAANANEEVRLASLAKVPLVMSILKKVEKGDLKLSDEITLKKEDLDDRFGDLWKAGAGATFTIEELIEATLRKSDNTSYNALYGILNDKEVYEVYDNLDVELSMENNQPIVSPKSYSSIFRSLYLSSYLNTADSEYILALLSKTDFKDKIPAGVPKDIIVSHKVGVFNKTLNPQNVYSDCGIVYIPHRPYILCIFVQNNDDIASKHSSMISKMVYTYVSGIKGGVE